MKPRTRVPALSRRRFLGGTAAALVLGTVAGLLPRVAPASVRTAVLSAARPVRQAAARRGWLERTWRGTPVAHPWRWECGFGRAALQLEPDGTVMVHEPGWGARSFRPADFASGYPQDTLRRVFGGNVLDELLQALRAHNTGLG